MVRRLASVLLLLGVGACGDPTIMVPGVLSVVTVLPSHGATGISPSVEALVYFSSAVKSPTAAAEQLELDCLGVPPCGSANVATCVGNAFVSTTVTFEINQVAKLKPDLSLTTNMCYGITVGAGIEAADNNIGPLPIDIHSAFETTP